MHPVLLIDEILRLIFEIVLDSGKSFLCCVARCCQAWKDPALDCIWRRLPSAMPLLSLLPGFLIERGNIQFDSTTKNMTFTTFDSYAIRVNHITHRHRILADLTSIPQIFKQLSNLESARIESSAVGHLTLQTCMAPRLRTLALQVGYTKSSSASITVHDMISLLKGCSSLEQLSVRGYSSECLHIPLSGLTTLRSLSLHLSSLTEQSFMTVSTFPYLVDLDVHADQLSFSIPTSQDSEDIPFFPALERLKIRAQHTVVVSILERLRSHKLCSLHIDAVTPGPASAFDDLFKTMSPFPLHDLTLEHALPTDDSQDTPAHAADQAFTMDHLRPLSKLPLRSFVLDTSLPPDLSDTEIEAMAKWWPRLERLHLGASMALEQVDAAWTPRTSLKSLVALARGCVCLQSLVIALDVGAGVSEDAGATASHPLTSLSISSRARPDISSVSAMLARLFPSLVDVSPGFVGENEDAWGAVQTTVSNFICRTS